MGGCVGSRDISARAYKPTKSTEMTLYIYTSSFCLFANDKSFPVRSLSSISNSVKKWENSYTFFLHVYCVVFWSGMMLCECETREINTPTHHHVLIQSPIRTHSLFIIYILSHFLSTSHLLNFIDYCTFIHSCHTHTTQNIGFSISTNYRISYFKR